jgi:hypothetical protein
MGSKSRTADDTTFDRRPASKRRSTRDGREPLVVYMRPESIKALKMAALEHDTTASAIVADAVASWLRSQVTKERLAPSGAVVSRRGAPTS